MGSPAPGERWDRPELHRLLDQLREGDTVEILVMTDTPIPVPIRLIVTEADIGPSEIEALATSTNLSVRAIQKKIAGRASRGIVGEITKRTRAACPEVLAS